MLRVLLVIVLPYGAAAGHQIKTKHECKLPTFEHDYATLPADSCGMLFQGRCDGFWWVESKDVRKPQAPSALGAES